MNDAPVTDLSLLLKYVMYYGHWQSAAELFIAIHGRRKVQYTLVQQKESLIIAIGDSVYNSLTEESIVNNWKEVPKLVADLFELVPAGDDDNQGLEICLTLKYQAAIRKLESSRNTSNTSMKFYRTAVLKSLKPIPNSILTPATKTTIKCQFLPPKPDAMIYKIFTWTKKCPKSHAQRSTT
jgi:hypothetical protein